MSSSEEAAGRCRHRRTTGRTPAGHTGGGQEQETARERGCLSAQAAGRQAVQELGGSRGLPASCCRNLAVKGLLSYVAAAATGTMRMLQTGLVALVAVM